MYILGLIEGGGDNTGYAILHPDASIKHDTTLTYKESIIKTLEIVEKI